MYSDPVDRQKLAAILLNGKTSKAKLGGAIILLADMLPGLVRLWQNLKGGPGEQVELGSIFDEAEAAGQTAREAQPPESAA